MYSKKALNRSLLNSDFYLKLKRRLIVILFPLFIYPMFVSYTHLVMTK